MRSPLTLSLRTALRPRLLALIAWLTCWSPTDAMGQVVIKLDGLPPTAVESPLLGPFLVPPGFQEDLDQTEPFLANDNGQPWLLREQLYRIAGVRADLQALGPCDPQQFPVLVVLWIGLTATVLVLAPYSRVLQLVVMNPRLRTVGSFFLIPLFLSSFPGLRRHLLRPYEKASQQDQAPS